MAPPEEASYFLSTCGQFARASTVIRPASIRSPETVIGRSSPAVRSPATLFSGSVRGPAHFVGQIVSWWRRRRRPAVYVRGSGASRRRRRHLAVNAAAPPDAPCIVRWPAVDCIPLTTLLTPPSLSPPLSPSLLTTVPLSKTL